MEGKYIPFNDGFGIVGYNYQCPKCSYISTLTVCDDGCDKCGFLEPFEDPDDWFEKNTESSYSVLNYKPIILKSKNYNYGKV